MDRISAAKSRRRLNKYTSGITHKLGLKQAGGNYIQIQKYLKQYGINAEHFKGKGWSKGLKGIGVNKLSLNEILVKGSTFESYKLKKRLFKAKLKKVRCELCGWVEKTKDGRIPLELDHVNGDNRDNRIENLRILCPNCHSLQPTHRGSNKKRSGGGTGIRAALKML